VVPRLDIDAGDTEVDRRAVGARRGFQARWVGRGVQRPDQPVGDDRHRRVRVPGGSIQFDAGRLQGASPVEQHPHRPMNDGQPPQARPTPILCREVTVDEQTVAGQLQRPPEVGGQVHQRPTVPA